MYSKKNYHLNHKTRKKSKSLQMTQEIINNAKKKYFKKSAYIQLERRSKSTFLGKKVFNKG